MSYNINTLSTLQQLVNTYLEEQGFCPMLSHELESVIEDLRNDRKIPAIKFVREVTRKSRPASSSLATKLQLAAASMPARIAALPLANSVDAWASRGLRDVAKPLPSAVR